MRRIGIHPIEDPRNLKPKTAEEIKNENPVEIQRRLVSNHSTLESYEKKEGKENK